MIDPNICKMVYCEVLECGKWALVDGLKIRVLTWEPVKPGKRRLYLRYSIFNDNATSILSGYYLSRSKGG